MKFTTATAAATAALSALAPAVLAELAVTSPVATTVCRAGSACSITWNDNNRGVSLEDQGECTVGLFTGSAQQQTFLQPIVFPDTVNVATTGEIVFTPDPSVGESGRFYFIRFTSQDLDQAGGAPYLSFSAHFTIEGMTGTFNSTVRAQIEGASISSTGRSVSTPSAGGSSTREISTTPRATRSSTASDSEETADNSDSGAAQTTFALGGAVGAFMLGLVGLAF